MINTFVEVYLSTNLPNIILPKKLPIKKAPANKPKIAGEYPRDNNKNGKNKKRV